jgi:hypothetical protein
MCGGKDRWGTSEDDTLSVAAQGHRAARGFTTALSPRAFSPPQKAAGRADARRARKSFNDQRNAGGEPNAADISDQESPHDVGDRAPVGPMLGTTSEPVPEA